MVDYWYKDAIVYSLDVKTFQDSNGDGWGDFQGLIQRLDHIVGLGANCLWLAPIHPSPYRDDGYDVTDYYTVDPRLGTLGDFVELVHEAHRRGLSIMLDLVVNHTSDQHPWFQEARRNPDSKFREFYIWSKDKPADAHKGMVFPGYQKSVWTYDEVAQAYYYHQFYEHQPDLNIASPRVRDEIMRIMGLWLDLGIAGFRLDAAPFLITPETVHAPHPEDNFAYLRAFRQFLSWRRGNAIIAAEANVTFEEAPKYFDPATQMHILFAFLVAQHTFLAMARQEAGPLAASLADLPEVPQMAQWAHFLRNHDELDLGRLSGSEQREVYDAFGPDPDMQLYDRGIRRRLAPMLGGNVDRMKLAYSLIFSLPGTPVIRYGDEIGMGDDLSLPERLCVRTPMQWSDAENAGFSTAPADRLVRPVISQGRFDYRKVNVFSQEGDPASFLNWMERLIRARRRAPELGWGKLEIVNLEHPAVLAHRCTFRDASMVALHNFSERPVTVSLPLADTGAKRLMDLLAEERAETLSIDDAIELPAFGHRWYRLIGGRWVAR